MTRAFCSPLPSDRPSRERAAETSTHADWGVSVRGESRCHGVSECDDLDDGEWAVIRALLPRCGPGGPDYRAVVNGILWQQRGGRRWHDLPARYGPWHRCAERLRHRRLEQPLAAMTATVIRPPLALLAVSAVSAGPPSPRPRRAPPDAAGAHPRGPARTAQPLTQPYQVGKARHFLEPVEKKANTAVIARPHGDSNGVDKLIGVLRHAESLHRCQPIHPCRDQQTPGAPMQDGPQRTSSPL